MDKKLQREIAGEECHGIHDEITYLRAKKVLEETSAEERYLRERMDHLESAAEGHWSGCDRSLLERVLFCTITDLSANLSCSIQCIAIVVREIAFLACIRLEFAVVSAIIATMHLFTFVYFLEGYSEGNLLIIDKTGLSRHVLLSSGDLIVFARIDQR